MRLEGLPLVAQRIEIGTRAYAIEAATDQDALLRATGTRDLLPFGLMLWESAIVLAQALDERPLNGLRVLDLGAGVGVVGLVAAANGAIVTLADVDPLALALCQRNVDRNGLGTQCEVALTDWHTWQPTQQFDVIAGADIIYDCDNHAAIIGLLKAAAAPGATILLADPMRLHAIAFLDMLERQGWASTTRTVETADLADRSTRVTVQIIAAEQA